MPEKNRVRRLGPPIPLRGEITPEERSTYRTKEWIRTSTMRAWQLRTVSVELPAQAMLHVEASSARTPPFSRKLSQ